MPTLNINGNILSDTEANWALDSTVYSNKTMLVSNDVQYGSTDQNKFKLANGVDTWSDLDYMPIGSSSGNTLVWLGQSFNPVDSTTYWLPTAQDVAPSTGTNGNRRHRLPIAASTFNLNIGLAANGSTELVTWTIRNHTKSTEANFSPGHAWTSGGQANAWHGTATLACDADDYIEIKLTTPNWTSNPVTVRITAILTYV